MLEGEMRSLIERGYTATASRDLAALRELMAPDIELESRFLAVGGRVYRGHDGLIAWLDDLEDAWERLEPETERVLATGPQEAVVLLTLHGVGRGSGVEVHEPVAQRITFRDGLVARVAYVDRSEADALAGGRARSGQAGASSGEAARVATFDCYGTLIDWEGGLGTFLYALARRNGDAEPEPGRELRERWEAIQFRLIREEGYRPYREILADALREWCGERGYRWNTGDGDALVESMRAWQPFPDTAPALREARDRGMRLVIVSNTDRDIIDHSLRQIGVAFDHVQTAEDVGAYKPDEGVFRRLLDDLGARPGDVLHVAFGFKYDIGPAQRLGMRTAWVNRHAEPPPGSERADHEWRDLWGLAEAAAVRP